MWRFSHRNTLIALSLGASLAIAELPSADDTPAAHASQVQTPQQDEWHKMLLEQCEGCSNNGLGS